MNSQPSILVQTLTRVTMLLKPLIDAKSCEIVRNNERIVFVVQSGSASVFVTVKDHPNIEDEALVTVAGVLTKLDPATLPIEVARAALALNNELNGFAIALDGDMLLLRGTLIGSVMDELEFNALFKTLAIAADDLDDKFIAALASKTQDASPGDAEGVVQGLKDLAAKLEEIIVDKMPALVQAFGESLDDSDKQEFAQLLKDEQFQKAAKDTALGAPAASLATLVLSNNISDEGRRMMGAKILEQVPEHHIIRKMLVFTVIVTASMVCKALGVEEDLIKSRLSAILA